MPKIETREGWIMVPEQMDKSRVVVAFLAANAEAGTGNGEGLS